MVPMFTALVSSRGGRTASDLGVDGRPQRSVP